MDYDDLNLQEKQNKKDRCITIDHELNEILKKQNINVSKLINQFLWYYIKRKEKDNKQQGVLNKCKQ